MDETERLDVDRSGPVRGLRRIPRATSTTSPATIDGRRPRVRRLPQPTRSSGRRRGVCVLPKSARGSMRDGSPAAPTCEGSSRGNRCRPPASSSAGGRIPEPGPPGGFDLDGNKQTLLRDPAATTPSAAGLVKSWGSIPPARSRSACTRAATQRCVQMDAGRGRDHLGRYPVPMCYIMVDGREVCDDRETVAYSVSDDGKVVTGASRLPCAVRRRGDLHPEDGLGPLADFLQGQGVLEASRWSLLGATISGARKDAGRHRLAARGRLLSGIPRSNSTRCTSVTTRGRKRRR